MSVKSYQLEYKNENTERIKKLSSKTINTRVTLCIERARYFTESYKETEGRDPLLRKALALKNLLEKMTIYINNDELIIGNNSSKARASVVAPEYSSNWLEKEINDTVKAPDIRKQDTHIIDSQVKQELIKDIFPYWSGRTVENRVIDKLPEKIIKSTIPSLGEAETIPVSPELYLRNGIGHVVVDYEILLKKGFKGILDEAKNKIKQLDFTDSCNISKYSFYKSVIIEYQAIINWILRYSELAEKLSQECKDAIQRDELKEISKNCKFISVNPPSTFWQAIQTCFFSELILFGLEQNCVAVSPGRLDQYLYPFYRKDIEKGIISKDKVIELIQCFFIKLSEMSILYDYDSASYWSGFSVALCVLVGGVDKDGNDATNELSYLILQADKNSGVLQPETAVRVHTNSQYYQIVDGVICLLALLFVSLPNLYHRPLF